MYNDRSSLLLLMKCGICKEERVNTSLEVCKACYKKKKNFQITLYGYKKKLEKEGMTIFHRTHGNFKFTMPYIIANLFKYKIADTKLGRFYRHLNLKEKQ